MPALPNVPGVLRISLVHTYSQDTDVVNRFYMSYTGTAPSNAALNSFCTAIGTGWNTDLAPHASPQVTLTGVEVVDLTTPSSGVGAATVSHAGTRTGTNLTAATAALLNMQVARRYRGGKPRLYLPMGTQSDMNNASTWSSSFTSGLETAWVAFVAAIVAAPPSGATVVSQVNVSYYSGFASVQNPVTLRWRNIATPRVTPLVDVIQSTSVNAKFGSQRRRNLH